MNKLSHNTKTLETTGITPAEYAAKHKVTTRWITKKLQDNKPLPGIKRVEKYGRFYLLIPA